VCICVHLRFHPLPPPLLSFATEQQRRVSLAAVKRAAPYLFLAPFLAVFATFHLYPLGRSLALSLCATPSPRRTAFVGLANYAYLVRDITFWLAVANTAAYVVAFLAVQLPLSLGLAMALNDRRVAGRNALRFAFFSTSLAGSVFAAIIFARLVDPRHGPVRVAWLASPLLARAAVLIAWLWLSVGFGMVYLLAALKAVDPALRDAAAVDGAGAASRFRHVTLPAIRPVLSFLLLAGCVSGFQSFELQYVLIGGPGPQLAGLTVVGYLYTVGFGQGNLGYASAVGWALVAITMVAAAPQWRLGRDATA
jgi:ABC-type sugar transport system permease subunit